MLQVQSPNFPPNLALQPLALSHLRPAQHEEDDDASSWDQTASIATHGIAGRLWEASLLLSEYLQPPSPSSTPLFDPSCSLFASSSPSAARARTVLELGSGIGYAALTLSTHLLNPGDKVIMTDLSEVVELMNERRGRFIGRRRERGKEEGAEVWVRPLAWGEGKEAALGQELASIRTKEDDGKLVDVVICSDLVYFPALYPPLIATLVALTSPPFDPPPEIIIAYKSRDISKESPFWDRLLQSGFYLTPVVHVPSGKLFGACNEDRMGIFLVRRQGAGEDVSSGAGGLGFEDLLLLGLEWD